MADITLTASTRANLLTAQRTDALGARTNRRLATGLRVNRPTHGPAAYFLAKALSDRAGDLLTVKDDIGQSLSLIGGAISGVNAMTGLIKQLQAAAAGAADQSAAVRAEQAAQFDEIRSQLDSLAADVRYAGINLLAAPPDDLAVAFNRDGSSSMTISGVASDSAALGIGTGAGAYNNFATGADIEAAIDNAEQAVRTLRSTATALGGNANVLNTRLDFTQDLANTLQGGAFRLTGADLNEEAANSLALNVSRQLSLASLNLVSQSQQAILQLF